MVHVSHNIVHLHTRAYTSAGVKPVLLGVQWSQSWSPAALGTTCSVILRSSLQAGLEFFLLFLSHSTVHLFPLFLLPLQLLWLLLLFLLQEFFVLRVLLCSCLFRLLRVDCAQGIKQRCHLVQSGGVKQELQYYCKHTPHSPSKCNRLEQYICWNYCLWIL